MSMDDKGSDLTTGGRRGGETVEGAMENKSLVLDLVEWVAECPRAYQEVMDAWRSSCPRLTIWEDTVDAGFVRMQSGENSKQFVFVTRRGLEFLQANGRDPDESAH